MIACLLLTCVAASPECVQMGQVFYKTADERLVESYWDKSTKRWRQIDHTKVRFSLKGHSSQSPCQEHLPLGKITLASDSQLFFRSTNSELVEYYWTRKAGWKVLKLRGAGGCIWFFKRKGVPSSCRPQTFTHGIIGGDPVAFPNRIFFRDVNRHLCMRSWDDAASAWNTRDLTSELVGVPQGEIIVREILGRV